MATYELYLWEPEVDLEDDQSQEILADAEDTFKIAYEIRNEIYYKYNERRADAPHLLKFFQYLYDVIKQPKYANYFEGMHGIIENDQDRATRARCIVWHDENILGNETSPEFKRVLYEAIEHSGICAYSSMDGLLCNTDSYTRRNALKDAFQLYPPLKTVKKSNKITSLEHIPKDVKEMREMVFLFMHQHPLGRFFELEEEFKTLSTTEKGYGLKFKRICDNGVKQRFKLSIKYSKKWERFELRASFFLYDFFAPYVKEAKKIYMAAQGDVIKSIDVFFNHGYVKSVREFENNEGKKHDIVFFRFKEEETKYFKDFLNHFNNCLDLFASIDSLDKLIDLFLYSDQTIFSVEDNFILPDYYNREISPYGVDQMTLAYQLFTYGNVYPEKVKKIEEYVLNHKYPDTWSEEDIKRNRESTEKFFKRTNLLNDYFVNPTKDWRELMK